MNFFQRIQIPAWNHSGLQIVVGGDIPDFSGKTLALSDIEIKQAFKIMALDFAEILAKEIPEMKEYIQDCLLEDESLGLLEALAMYNLYEEGKFDATKVKININDEEADCFYKLVQPTLFIELFEQIIYYSTNGKLYPPELRTLGNLESARSQSASAVIELLSKI